MRALMSVLFVFLLAMLPLPVLSQTLTEGPDWQPLGREYLTFPGRPVVLDAGDLEFHKNRIRCVKMNNYGCIMGKSWNGGIGNDSAGHRVFEHPKWSVRAVVRDYCAKYKRNLRSALQIAEAYSPWCDTHGTKEVVNGWGRSCSDGVKPPKSFKGPLCKKPDIGVPSQAQCENCNCPNIIAKVMVRGLDVTPEEELQLFEAGGKPNASRLGTVLKNKFKQEIGFTVSDGLITEGIELAGLCK